MEDPNPPEQKPEDLGIPPETAATPEYVEQLQKNIDALTTDMWEVHSAEESPYISIPRLSAPPETAAAEPSVEPPSVSPAAADIDFGESIPRSKAELNAEVELASALMESHSDEKFGEILRDTFNELALKSGAPMAPLAEVRLVPSHAAAEPFSMDDVKEHPGPGLKFALDLSDIKSKLYGSPKAAVPTPPTVAKSALIRSDRGIRVSTAGELGDAIYLLAILKDLPGGPHTILLREHPQTSNKIVRRPEVFAALALSQNYVANVRLWKPGDKEQWESALFRPAGYHRYHTTLVKAHAMHGQSVGVVKTIPNGYTKWLDVAPNEIGRGKVVIGRTDRWRNGLFPWRAVVNTYGPLLLFLGTPDEHRCFCEEFGHVKYHPTTDLLEATQIIAGSWLFISNQTSLWALAEGLKVRRIQETCRHQTDCVYLGGDVQHCIDGEVRLPLPEGGETLVPSTVPTFSRNISIGTLPPNGGWRYPGLPPARVFGMLHAQVMARFSLSHEDAWVAILKETTAQNPDFFPAGERAEIQRHLKEALDASG